MIFDCVAEAQEFYGLYSREVGFEAQQCYFILR